MIGIIVARSRNNCIGKDGNLPWHIPGELEQFRKLTTGNNVIMGRKTYEAIGHPLCDRKNIVVSTTMQPTEGITVVSSLKEALDVCEPDQDIYITGGYSIFKEALPITDVIYMTEVHTEIKDGDVFFPDFDESQYIYEKGETVSAVIPYTRTTYTRKTQI